MSNLSEPFPPRPYPETGPAGRKREFGEGRSGVILAIAAVVGLVAFGVALVLFPALLAWLLALGLLFLALVAVLFVIVAIVVFFITIGLGAYHLFKRDEVQGPEEGYTLDMVEEPKKENR
jgi:hypothetical protein